VALPTTNCEDHIVTSRPTIVLLVQARKKQSILGIGNTTSQNPPLVSSLSKFNSFPIQATRPAIPPPEAIESAQSRGAPPALAGALHARAGALRALLLWQIVHH